MKIWPTIHVINKNKNTTYLIRYQSKIAKLIFRISFITYEAAEVWRAKYSDLLREKPLEVLKMHSINARQIKESGIKTLWNGKLLLIGEDGVMYSRAFCAIK